MESVIERLEDMKILCPLCGSEMLLYADLMNNNVNFYCGCDEYVKLEEIYIENLFNEALE